MGWRFSRRVISVSEMGDFDGANYKDGFIAELVTFVAGNNFQGMFEAFFIEHATKFSLAEEHQLHYYEIYQKFHDMFEGQLEEFCSRSNLTETDFMLQCRAAREKDEKARHYVDILLSSVEYETFVKLMKIMRPLAESRLSAKAETKVGRNSSADCNYANYNSLQYVRLTYSIDFLCLARINVKKEMLLEPRTLQLRE